MRKAGAEREIATFDEGELWYSDDASPPASPAGWYFRPKRASIPAWVGPFASADEAAAAPFSGDALRDAQRRLLAWRRGEATGRQVQHELAVGPSAQHREPAPANPVGHDGQRAPAGLDATDGASRVARSGGDAAQRLEPGCATPPVEHSQRPFPPVADAPAPMSPAGSAPGAPPGQLALDLGEASAPAAPTAPRRGSRRRDLQAGDAQGDLPF